MKTILKKLSKKFLINQPTIDLKAIEKYRELDSYSLDIEIFPPKNIDIPQRLPSEPPEGITYSFGPSGYSGHPNSNYCLIPTTWRNVNNYCHWNFSELPLLFLAFESKASNIILPDSIINGYLPFQIRWMKILSELYPDKKIYKISKIDLPSQTLIPYNHDTSSNTRLIGNCTYKNYHHSRATPYLINRIETFYKNHFQPSRKLDKVPYIYISRSNRKLINENEIQQTVEKYGFKIIKLEKLRLDDQVYLFSNAKIIIGFHGAGLSNLLYARSEAAVLEIVDRDCVHPCYKDGITITGKKATKTYFHMLSVMKGMEYHPLESNNYHLDMNLLIDKLESIGTLIL